MSGPGREQKANIPTGDQSKVEAHASYGCDPEPHFHQTEFASHLTSPRPQTRDTTTLSPDTSQVVRATQLDDSQMKEHRISWPRSAALFATSLITSNNLYTSIGNVVITANLYSGALLHPACALLAIANEAREKRRGLGEYSNPTPRFSGLTQKALDLWRSPGVYRVALSGVFLINSIESLAGGNLLFSAVYICASLGNVGAARTLNQDYFRGLYEARGLEYRPQKSLALQMATSPGINWSITDVLIGMMTLPALGALGTSIAYGATAFACAALIAPIVLGRRAAESPLLLACNAASNFGFSAVHALWGSTTIAIACCGWGIASGIIALKQRGLIVKQQSSYRGVA